MCLGRDRPCPCASRGYSQTPSTLLIPIGPRNSTLRCFLLYLLDKPVLPCPMYSAPILVCSAASAFDSLLPFPAAWHSSKNVEPGIMPFNPACPPFARPLNHLESALTQSASVTPLESALTKIPGAIPPVRTPNHEFSTPLYLRGFPFLFMDLPPLLRLQRVKSFAIRQIQPLFQKHPGWGYLDAWTFSSSNVLTIGRPSATWTRPAHPTIIAPRSRFQVYG